MTARKTQKGLAPHTGQFWIETYTANIALERLKKNDSLTHSPDMKNSRCGMAGGQICKHSPDIKKGRGGNPGRLTGKIELRGGMGGG